MAQRGRKSSASKASDVVAVESLRRSSRLPAPLELSDYEILVWGRVVDAMPAGWFDGSHEAMLTAYCKHVATARLVDEELATCEPEWLKRPDGLARFQTLTNIREKQTRAITSCARSMRLTHQAQILPRGAARSKSNNPAAGDRAPWET